MSRVLTKVREGKNGNSAIYKPSHQTCDVSSSSPKYVYVNRDGGLPSAWQGTEVYTEFKFPKDFGVIDGLSLAIDVNNSGATAATLLPTPLWLSRIEVYLGADILETIYAEDQLHETIGFRTHQAFDQINEAVNMTEDYDLAAETLAANAQAQRFYLPLDGTMISAVRPFVAGYKATWKLRCYFASSIHIGAYVPTLSEVQLIMEQSNLSETEMAALRNAHASSVVDSTFYSRQRQQEVLPLNSSNSAGTPLYLRSFKNNSAGLMVYVSRQNPVNGDRLRLLPVSTLQLQDSMGNKITEVLRGDFLKPFIWANHIDSPYTTYSTELQNPHPSQPSGANVYLIPLSASFQDAVFRGCDFGTRKLTTQEKLMIVPDGSQHSGTFDPDEPPSRGYFETAPATYNADLSFGSTGAVNYSTWQDTQVTAVSYDFGHLLVANGEHFVSYEGNK